MSGKTPVLGQAARVVECGCIVGESLIWDDRAGHLLWVDMLGRHIHVYDPLLNAHWTHATPGMITSIGLRKDGGYVVGLERSVALWDPGADFTPLIELEPDRPANRLNEGIVGPDGCFWVGTMQNNVGPDGHPRDQSEASGQVWRISPKGRAELMVSDGFWLTNTIAWLKGRVVIGDTGANTLYSFDAKTGDSGLTDKRPFLTGYDKGLPDGSCVDADGHLWNCRVVGGAEVLHVSPDGTPIQKIETPCTWPTSCVFGGPKLDRLYITSARFTMTEDHLRASPWEGDLFACKVPGIHGTLHHRFG